MSAPSIAFATDLVARMAEGGTVARAEGFRVVATPANPAYRWGSFLLADAGADLTRPEAWAARHRAAFPGAGFVTVGVDDADARIDEAAWRAAGFDVERSAVLVADVTTVARADPAAVEPETDDDWADVAAIGIEEGPSDPVQVEFELRRVAAERTAVATGSAAWLGLREGGRIVSALGVVAAGDGVARYQNVATRAAYRRRGSAGRLVRAAAALAAARWASSTLVIVADVDGPAIALYRRLGFRDAETQLQLTRIDGS